MNLNFRVISERVLKMKKAVWLSYDIGVKGDYEGLYIWLDNHEAVECGDSQAFFFYMANEDLIIELKEELKQSVELRKRDRIYVIWKDGDKIRGKFIFGNRKAAPWTGYGNKETEIEEEI